MSQFSVAVVGATGAVGQEMLEILPERNFPASELFAVASKRSAGSEIDCGDQKLIVQDLENFDFSKVDIGLFSPGSSVSKIYAPKAAEQGCVVIDNTSQFRQDADIPLIVPEVNPEAIKDYKNRGIIANPNCSTIQMLVALKPLHDFSPIKRIIVSTYQAVSGTGTSAIEELKNQSRQILDGESPEIDVYPKQIAFNALAHIDDFTENGQTKEEMKMHNETRKIFGDDNIMVSATAVRVPVVYGHSEAVLIETESPIDPEKARELLAGAPGVKLIDNLENLEYPTAIDAAGKDEVFVGRIRKDLSSPNGLWLWVVSDNLRKGAALNSIQIAELLIRQDGFGSRGA